MLHETIDQRLRAALTLADLHIQANGNHVTVLAVSTAFATLSRVQRQQAIYAPLLDLIQSNEIHALTIKTFTPDQWERERHFLLPL